MGGVAAGETRMGRPGCSAPERGGCRAALGAFAVALAGGIQAGGLFLPVGPADAAAGGAAAARTGPTGRTASATRDAWERRVRVARHELAVARADVEAGGPGRLLFNLRDGVHLDVAVERTAPTRYGYHLSGRVVGGAAGVGFVTLVVHDEAVAGSVWTPDSAYELNYLGGGVHALRDVTNAPPVECAGALQSDFPSADSGAESGTDDGSVVDILVVWTPAEEAFVGGEVSMLSLIDRNVAFANDAFERSGAFVSLYLVGAERVDYLETDIFTDLDRLATPDDGYMDEVHDLRDAFGADLVHLKATPIGGATGLAQYLGAFSINVFAHEVGHNFGLSHGRFQDFHADLYHHGFTTEDCLSTIMSYGACERFVHTGPFYASPWRYDPRDGRALGVSRLSKERGVRGPADAVRRLNKTRHRVANFRQSRTGK